MKDLSLFAKPYSAPVLTEYGNIATKTGIFGTSAVQDQSFDPNGTIINQQTGSIDQCATRNDQFCL